MSCHRRDISQGWKLGGMPYGLNKWYVTFPHWECGRGSLKGRKDGDWFQALLYANCKHSGDFTLTTGLRIAEKGGIARICLNYSVQRLAYYCVEFREGAAPEVFYVFQELYDHAVIAPAGKAIEAGREYAFRAELRDGTATLYLDGEEWGAFPADCPCGRYTALAVVEGSAEFGPVELKDGNGKTLFYDDFQADSLDNFRELEYGDLCVDEWIDAEIPGSVQSSLLARGKIPDPYVGRNGPEQMWTDDRVWVYRKVFEIPDEEKGKPCRVVFEGVDYHYFVFVNRQKLAFHEGMYGSELEIGDYLTEGENELTVCLLPVAALPPHSVVRPYIFHRWHFNMDVVPQGVWRRVWLDFYDKVLLLEPQAVTREIRGDTAVLELSVTVVNLALWPYKIRGKFVLTPPDGGKPTEIAFAPGFFNGSMRVERTVEVADAKLWWPNGMGDQPLYEVKISLDLYEHRELTGHDELRFRTGIRTLRTIPEPGRRCPPYPAKAPNTRLNAFYNWCFCVNGKSFFAKGANFMPIDQLYRLPREQYERILRLAKDCNMNMLRPWGGGLIETDDFYDLCDELGLCVWQDLPMSCGYYGESSPEVWRDTVKRAALRLRNHPCLAVWCGGNEIDPDCAENSGIIDLAENLLAEYDPAREFRRACPYGGDNHSYVVNWQGGGDYSKYRLDVSPAVTEFSMASPMCVESLKKVVSQEELERWPLSFPDDLSAFGYGNGERRESGFSLHDAHLNSVTSRMFPPMSDCGIPKSAEEFVRYLQTAHGLLLQYGNDWFRSRWPDCGVALSWVFNAPDPDTLCWSIVDYFEVPKIAYYDCKRIFAPLHVGATGFEFCTPRGGEFSAKLFAVCEGEELRGCVLAVRLYDSGFSLLQSREKRIDLGRGVSPCGSFVYRVPEDAAERTLFLVVDLARGGELLSRSVYCPRIGQPSERMPYYADGPHISDCEGRRTLLEASLSKDAEKGMKLAVTNQGDYPAFQVTLELPEGARASDNYFWMEPGERREIDVALLNNSPVCAACRAWNADRVAAEGGE